MTRKDPIEQRCTASVSGELNEAETNMPRTHLHHAAIFPSSQHLYISLFSRFLFKLFFFSMFIAGYSSRPFFPFVAIHSNYKWSFIFEQRKKNKSLVLNSFHCCLSTGREQNVRGFFHHSLSLSVHSLHLTDSEWVQPLCYLRMLMDNWVRTDSFTNSISIFRTWTKKN